MISPATLNDRLEALDNDDNYNYELRIGTEHGQHTVLVEGTVAASEAFDRAKNLMNGNSHHKGIYHLELGTLIVRLRDIVSLELTEVPAVDQ